MYASAPSRSVRSFPRSSTLWLLGLPIVAPWLGRSAIAIANPLPPDASSPQPTVVPIPVPPVPLSADYWPTPELPSFMNRTPTWSNPASNPASGSASGSASQPRSIAAPNLSQPNRRPSKPPQRPSSQPPTTKPPLPEEPETATNEPSSPDGQTPDGSPSNSPLPQLPIAQSPQSPPSLPPDTPNPQEPNRPTQQLPPQLPPPEQLFQLPTPNPAPIPSPTPSQVPDRLRVRQFEVVGNTVFKAEELAAITQPFLNRDLTFTDLNQVASQISDLYTKAGYVNSGAFIPAEQVFSPSGTVVKIQILEGSLETIVVNGTNRLDPNYVRSRLGVAAGEPLNVNRLVEGLQLLQLNPLFKTVQANLSASAEPGKSVLTVDVVENPDTFDVEVRFDNSRSPAIGTDQRRIQLREGNLLGLGDAITLGYSNTDGSNAVDVNYTLPINPYNGTLSLGLGFTSSRVIEFPFTALNISASSSSVELTFRQPLLQTPSTEFALGLTANYRDSQAFLFDGALPFPAQGADRNGRTTVTALRFFQEWVNRSDQSVVALRSQFSFGVNALGATLNLIPPDSQFLTWRGQAQWVQLLAPDTFLLLRGDLQLADRPLVPAEQFGIGGPDSIRGYRQDQLLTDSGVFASAELRVPILRIPEERAILHLTPFVELGQGWNAGDVLNPDPSFLAAAGLGLRFQVADRLNVRFGWGMPLVPINASRRNTWQENGFFFSLNYTLF